MLYRLTLALAVFAISLLSVPVALAQGGISLTASFSHVLVDAGSEVTIDLELANETERSLDVVLDIADAPESPWSMELEGKLTTFGVRSTTVKADAIRALQLRVAVPDDAEPGDYPVRLTARSADGVYSDSLTVTVAVRSPEEGKKTGVVLDSRFRALRGPTTSTFAFTVTVRNQSPDPVTVNLGAQAEPTWQVRVKPAFEDKFISSVTINGNSSENLDLEITPPRNASPGDHTVILTADTGFGQESTEFTVTLTGTKEVRVRPVTGRLNSAATTGETSSVALVVQNQGTGTVQGIDLVAEAPEGWEVLFDPPRIDAIEPNRIRQVLAQITPPGDAIPGDYRVTVTARSPEVSDRIDLTISATQSAVWGWVGLAIVLLVILGMAVLFIRVGRR